MAKITGIGGVFFVAEDQAKLKAWYRDILGIPVNDFGHMFRCEDSDEFCMLQWSIFEKETNYLEPSTKKMMINYRVDNLEEFIEEIKAKGVEPVDDMSVYPYGKFVHYMDPEGNKIELWEPKNPETLD
ncbi:MAG: VOC family protein [Flavobacteriales bacterium]|jgi:lactoylglutathione lyase|nr:VOC family protein [Flavobacteriales bacterium]